MQILTDASLIKILLSFLIVKGNSTTSREEKYNNQSIPFSCGVPRVQRHILRVWSYPSWNHDKLQHDLFLFFDMLPPQEGHGLNFLNPFDETRRQSQKCPCNKNNIFVTLSNESISNPQIKLFLKKEKLPQLTLSSRDQKERSKS